MPSAFPSLKYLPCTGAVSRTIFTAPGPIIAVTYNGIFEAPNQRYTVTGNIVTFTFNTELGDQIYALCVA